eukprot:scaffold1954_cov268-Pinguiococcus_pyrenoidosus.AAC.297
MRARVRHAQDSCAVVSQSQIKLVSEVTPPDALPARSRPLGIAALRHEARYDAMENGAVVVPFLAKAEEVVRRSRHHISVDLEVQVPESRLQLNKALLAQSSHLRVDGSYDLVIACLSLRPCGAHADCRGRESAPRRPRSLSRSRRHVGRRQGDLPLLKLSLQICQGRSALCHVRTLLGISLRLLCALALFFLLLLDCTSGLLRNSPGGLDCLRDVSIHVRLPLRGFLLSQLLQVLEARDIPAPHKLRVARVLEPDDVRPEERLAGHEVDEVLRLEVELFHGVIAEDVSGGANRDHPRVRPEGLVRHGAVPLALGVLLHVQAQQLLRLHGLSRDGTLLVLLQVRHDRQQIEEHAVWSTHGILIRSQRERAAVKRQSLVFGAPTPLHGPPAVIPPPLRGREKQAVL